MYSKKATGKVVAVRIWHSSEADRPFFAGLSIWSLELGSTEASAGGQRRLEGAKGQGRLCAFAFSPDGKILAGGTGAVKHGDRAMAGGQVLLWDPQTGRLIKTLGDHGAVVTSLAFSGDGKTLASTSVINSLVKLWDMRTGKLVRTLTLTGTIKRVSHASFFLPTARSGCRRSQTGWKGRDVHLPSYRVGCSDREDRMDAAGVDLTPPLPSLPMARRWLPTL